MEDCPGFIEAKQRFTRFLASQGHPEDVHWVFRDDFYRRRAKPPVVRWPLHEMNEILTRQHFEVARYRGHGVELAALFYCASRTFAHVWYPESEEEADYSLISGLKLSVPEPLPEAILEESEWCWSVRRHSFAYRRHQEHEEGVRRRAMAAA
jgi:hypothetical protein